MDDRRKSEKEVLNDYIHARISDPTAPNLVPAPG